MRGGAVEDRNWKVTCGARTIPGFHERDLVRGEGLVQEFELNLVQEFEREKV